MSKRNTPVILRGFFTASEEFERDIYLLAAKLKANVLRDDSSDGIELSINCRNIEESEQLELQFKNSSLPLHSCFPQIPT